jgi:hypothetical protein
MTVGRTALRSRLNKQHGRNPDANHRALRVVSQLLLNGGSWRDSSRRHAQRECLQLDLQCRSPRDPPTNLVFQWDSRPRGMRIGAPPHPTRLRQARFRTLCCHPLSSLVGTNPGFWGIGTVRSRDFTGMASPVPLKANVNAEINVGYALPEDNMGNRSTVDKKVDASKYTPASDGCN